MPGRFVGHRGSRDSEWSWERTDEISRSRRWRWLPAALLSTAFVAGIAALAFGIFLIVTNDNGDAAPPFPSASPSPQPTTVRTPTATPTPSPTPTPAPAPTATLAPTPTPGPTYTVEFASWSDVEDAWIAPAHDETTSGYTEGDMVPFLLRIEDAEIGETYAVRITYGCVSSGEPAFDYIGGTREATAEAALTDPGPGRAVPDSTLTALDDRSIPYDDEEVGGFRVWGAVFTAAEGPSPATECRSTKSVVLSLRAQQSNVFLVWTGHLASAADWGAGNGASRATPFDMDIDVNGEAQSTVTMAAGSVIE